MNLTVYYVSVFVEGENKVGQLGAISIFRGSYSMNIHMMFPFGNNKTCTRYEFQNNVIS